MFNFDKFVNLLYLDAFLLTKDILPCECSDSPFVGKYHDHIITSALHITNNSILRNIFCKGANIQGA